MSHSAVMNCSTLSELLLWRAKYSPDALAFRFLQHGGVKEDIVSNRELLEAAQSIAGGLAALSKRPTVAILACPSGIDYIAALFGCLFANVITVPVLAPRSKGELTRLAGIVEDCNPDLALTTQTLQTRLGRDCSLVPALRSLRWVAVEDLKSRPPRESAMHSNRPDQLAYLQYTSGSTSKPKGVMISHENILRNTESIDREFRHDGYSSIVSWLPLFHDMGLVYGVLQPLYSGIPSILMPAQEFVQQPLRWLRTIDRYQATHSGAPNFAYELCVRAASGEDIRDINLASWQVAFNGAETVRDTTLERFARTFHRCGFRPEKFYPAYGMAEATLKVSSRTHGCPQTIISFDADALRSGIAKEVPRDAQKNARVLVGCGWSDPATEILIVDPENLSKRNDGRVGEIWVSGPGVGLGYWKRAEETERVFAARLSNKSPRAYLRTGDLGFIQNRELFITGRLKDLIIVRGRNHHPEDIELTIQESHLALSRGRGTAFTVNEGDDRIVIVHEVERKCSREELSEICGQVRQSIGQQYELGIQRIDLVRPMSLPRTSSGKLRRSDCREQFLTGNLSSTYTDESGEHRDDLKGEPSSFESQNDRHQFSSVCDIETFLKDEAAKLLGIKPGGISGTDRLTRFGLDSLMALQLSKRAGDRFGIEILSFELLRDSTIRSLATEFASRLSLDKGINNGTAAVQQEEFGSAGGSYGLSCEQERLWLASKMSDRPAAYHVTATFHWSGPLDVSLLQRSVDEIVKRHQVLRASFHMGGGGLSQRVNDVKIPVSVIDLLGLPDDVAERERLRAATLANRRPFDLMCAPLARLWVICAGKLDQDVVITLHHLIADARSLDIFIEELSKSYTALLSGKTPRLSIIAKHYWDFVSDQRHRLQPNALRDHLLYWQEQLANLLPRAVVPLVPEAALQSDASDAYEKFEISEDDTGVLRTLGQEEGSTLFMTLLAAFSIALRVWTGDHDVPIGSPVLGREPDNTDGLIGLFAYPLVLRIRYSPDLTFRDLVGLVRDIALKAYQHQVPFAKVLERARLRGMGGRSPLFRVMFTHLQSGRDVHIPNTKLRRIADGYRDVDVDLSLIVVSEGKCLRGILYGNCSKKEIAAFAKHYCRILNSCAANPEQEVSEFLTESKRDANSVNTEQDNRVIAIAATFTAEPLREFIAFWMRKLRLPYEIRFAPYNQVFQQLLDRSSLFARNSKGLSVLLLRWEDLEGHMATSEMPEAKTNDAWRGGAGYELARVIRDATWVRPLVVCICPPSPAWIAIPERAAHCKQMNDQLADALEAEHDITLVSQEDLLKACGKREYYDSYQDRLVSSPYSSMFLASLATVVARKAFGLASSPYKVIVVDCDETLWRGFCGDNSEVTLDEKSLMLQRFIVEKQQAGFLICVCSKNHECDVAQVFEGGLAMPLKPEHVVGWRVNWKPKSENILSLASELQLPVDSFIFIDDDALECAEVEARCPNVLTLRVPETAGELRSLLRNVWAFDRSSLTPEDEQRSRSYQQERARHAGVARTLREFVENLGLSVEFSELSTATYQRASQLTMRANQFNATNLRWPVAELKELCDLKKIEAVAVTVRDRFGDYGLVGLLAYRIAGDRLDVVNFVLSCRALGRGVEHRMVARLGELAISQKLAFVGIPFVHGQKNTPVRGFLKSIGADELESDGDRTLLKFRSSLLAALTYAP